MEIYSHRGIEDQVINTKHQYTNDYDEVAEFSIGYDKSLVVNMPYVGTGENSTNEQGWLRDLNYYFEELYSRNPEYFSKRNVELIKKRRSPYCDKVFIEYFPEYEQCIGSKLIHHHIGRDGQVVAVPSDIHVGQGGVHLVEKKNGIDTNAINFSNKVSEAVEKGDEFKWEEVEKYQSEPINSSESSTKDESNQYIEDKVQKGNNSHKINEDNQMSGTTSSNINSKGASRKKDTTSGKGFWTTTVEVASKVIKSPTGKVLIVGLGIAAASQTPIGKKVIKETSDKLLKSNIGKDAVKEMANQASKETKKEVAKKTAKIVAKEVITKSIVGVAKSPHVRKAHTRKLASGVIIHVKEAVIHRDLLL